MAIIVYLGSTVEEYREKSLNILESLEISCPDHFRKMALHGHYTRVIKESGEEILIYRLICHESGKTHSILPDFLQPHKQYSANEIERAFNESDAALEPCETKVKASIYTRRRWLKTMGAKVIGWVSQMMFLAADTTGRTPSLVLLADLPPIKQIITVAEYLPKIKTSGNALGMACMYLGFRFPYTP